MKTVIPIFLALAICVAMLASCGLSATQVIENLKEKDYTTSEWTQEQIDSRFTALIGDEYTISVVYGAYNTEGEVVTVIQLDTLSQAKDFVDELKALREDGKVDSDSYIVAEGRLVIVGSEKSVNDALGK